MKIKIRRIISFMSKELGEINKERIEDKAKEKIFGKIFMKRGEESESESS